MKVKLVFLILACLTSACGAIGDKKYEVQQVAVNGDIVEENVGTNSEINSCQNCLVLYNQAEWCGALNEKCFLLESICDCDLPAGEPIFPCPIKFM